MPAKKGAIKPKTECNGVVHDSPFKAILILTVNEFEG